jgi:hypothetical protein
MGHMMGATRRRHACPADVAGRVEPRSLPAAEPPETPTVIRAGTLIDGEGAPPRHVKKGGGGVRNELQ